MHLTIQRESYKRNKEKLKRILYLGTEVVYINQMIMLKWLMNIS